MNDFDFDYRDNGYSSDIDRMLGSYMRTRRTDDLEFTNDSIDSIEFSDDDLNTMRRAKKTAKKAVMFN